MALALVVKYWREIALALLALAVIAACLYVRAVFAERDHLKQANAVLAEQVKSAEKIAEMNNRIAEAISQIRIRSSVNVQRIESEPSPVFVDARPIPFIPGGLPQGVYSSAAHAGAVPDPAPGGSLSSAQSAGGVLPD